MGRQKGKGTLQRERSGKWTIRATINGVRKTKCLDTTDRAEAERQLEEFMRPYVKGDNVRSYYNFMAAVATDEKRAEIEEDKKPQLKLADAWAAYLESPLRRDLTDTTLENKLVSWNVFVNWLRDPYPEAVEVRHVKSVMVEKFLKEQRVGRAASTYNNRVCILREIFRVLGPKARCKSNPFDGVKLLDDDSHSRRELTVEELKRLSDAASRVGDEWRKLFAIGVYTGMRIGDCATLLWTEVDIVRSIIQRIFRKTKRFAHGKPTTIPIHPALAEIFRETPADKRTGYVLPEIAAAYLVPKTGRPKIAYQLKKIFNAAGIVTSVAVEGRTCKAPEATFHSLRHTFVSISANAGVPLHIVQSIVGHESTAMTRHYYHENETALKKAIAAIPAIGETEGVQEPKIVDLTSEQAAALPFAPSEVIDVPAVTPEARPIDLAVGREPTRADDPQVHARVGGRVARPRPPKTAWIGDVVRTWAKRKNTGVLEGTMTLVKNGGYKFLMELYDRQPDTDYHEAIDAMEAYLYALGK